MKVFTAAQIKEWDAYTIQHELISSLALMERAARACYQWIKNDLPVYESHKQHAPAAVKVFCGKGNNGGDGLAIARMLLADKTDVRTYVLNTAAQGSPDFENNLQLLKNISSEVFFIDNESSFPELNNNDVIIDALFGTGLNEPLREAAAALATHINQSGASIVSIDIPSGILADKSSKAQPAIRADYTLSFQTYKTCFLLPENQDNTGRIFILDIGLHAAFEKEEAVLNIIDTKMIREIYRPRKSFSHKGTFGHALVMAGSTGKMGAAVLCSAACLRSGVGLLTTHLPKSGCKILQTTTAEAMVTSGDITDFTKYNVAGAGPGWGTEEDAVELLTHLIQNKQQLKNNSKDACSLVLDADALNILSSRPGLLKQLPANSILTPHPKEFERLFGKAANDFEQLELALQKAAQYSCFIILKGHHSFIATPKGKGYFNNTGNAGMATGGSGDVLTGLLTGLAAQGYSALETCLLGAYLHGLAGDIAAEELSQEAMIASNIVNAIGKAFKTVSGI